MSIRLYEFIEKTISLFEAENNIENMWRSPLAAALPADHPLIPSLKQSVSQDHFLPEEILPGAKSILIFFIPFHARIIESNLKGEAASEEWAKAYIFTNALLGQINDETEKYLKGFGFLAAKIKPTHNFDERTLMSRWSHRHLAWMAGLGSFGINNMLITSRGCCGRLGSLVTNAGTEEFGIPVKSGPAEEKCLNKRNGSCGLCLEKCVNDSYSGGSFDRHKCYDACLKNAMRHKAIGLADVCGKCLVGLPCSNKDPSER